jgi:hypothetical protein
LLFPPNADDDREAPEQDTTYRLDASDEEQLSAKTSKLSLKGHAELKGICNRYYYPGATAFLKELD